MPKRFGKSAPDRQHAWPVRHHSLARPWGYACVCLRRSARGSNKKRRGSATGDQVARRLRSGRSKAHIFVAFLAYCLHVTLKQRLRSLAPGLTSRSVLEKMAAIQMVDVQLPTTDGRTVILSRYTEPGVDQAIMLQRLRSACPLSRRPG